MSTQNLPKLSELCANEIYRVNKVYISESIKVY